MGKKPLTAEQITEDILRDRNKQKFALRKKIVLIIHKSLNGEEMRGRDIANVLSVIISEITDDEQHEI